MTDETKPSGSIATPQAWPVGVDLRGQVAALERRESELSDLLKEKTVEAQRLRDQIADAWDDGAAAAFELLGMDHQDRLRNPHRDDDEAGA